MIVMNAEKFTQYVDGPDAGASFRQAVDDALFANGFGGYSGTIAEKSGYLVLDKHPMTYEQALAIAEELLELHDIRVYGVDAPAAALRVKDPGYDGWLFFGMAAA